MDFEWKPIDTAPKDGTPILVLDWRYGYWHPQIVSWRMPPGEDEFHWLDLHDDDWSYDDARYWMEMPKLPKKPKIVRVRKTKSEMKEDLDYLDRVYGVK